MSDKPAPKARGRAAALMQRLGASRPGTSASRPGTATSRPTTAEPQQESPAPAPELTSAAVSVREAAQRVEAASKPEVPPRGRRERPPELPRPEKKFCDDQQIFPTECNYLRVQCDLPEGGLYQHVVSFDPEVENFRLRILAMRQQAVLDIIGETNSFDGGSTLFLPHKVENEQATISHPASGSPVNVNVKFTNIVKLGNLMFFFNGIIKKLMEALEWARIGRDNHYYNPQVRHRLTKWDLEIWPGFATSCKRDQDGGLVIEMDVSSHVLRTETVLQVFQKLFRQGGNIKDEFTKAVLNEVVSTRYNNRTYRIEDIDFDQTPLSTFEQSNGDPISFIDYYRNQHGIHIQDPKQPMLVSKLKAGRWGGKGRQLQGQQPIPDRIVLLVPELCYLTGLADSQRSDFSLMRDVGEYTRLTPIQRVQAIQKFLQAVHGNRKCQEILQRWKLNISPDLVRVDGHLFQPETIFTGSHRQGEQPNRCDRYDPGDFSSHINRAKPLSTVPMTRWHIIFTRQSQNQAREFLSLIRQTSNQVSVDFENPVEHVVPSARATEYVAALRAVAQQKPSIVVIILGSRSDEHYSAVKKECNLAGLPSQCVIARTLSNPRKISSICRRIFLQMEAKLGGELWGMSMPPAGLLVCGLDVFHDPTRRNPSWVALVGSFNQQQTRYFSVACRQKPGEEAAHGVALAFTKLLTAYRQMNSHLPKKIIVFRDGLSGSQFKMSQMFEIKQIREAFRGVDQEPEYNPELVFIVCVKRIGVRIFANTSTSHKDNYANPPPGTALDRVIGEPNWYDFYLISQAVRQGAVSPTHYVVIEDTSRFNAKQIQRLTWKFTHLYYNWPGTVRSPAPVVYADRLAAMVGQVLLKEPNEKLCDKLFFL